MRHRGRATPRLGMIALGAVGAAVGTGLALWLFASTDRVQAPAWGPPVLGAVVVAVGLHMAAHAANGARMSILSQGRVPWMRGWLTVTVGVFGAAATPARVGGEALKAMDLRRAFSWPSVLTLLLAERMFDLIVLALGGALTILTITWLFDLDAPVSLLAATAVLATTAFLFWGLTRMSRWRNDSLPSGSDRIAGLTRTIREGLAGIAALPRSVSAAALLLTVLIWSLELASFVAVARWLSIPIGTLHALVLVLGVTLIQALPLLPSGAGTVEAYVGLLLPSLGAQAGAAYIVWRATVLSYDLVVGGVTAAIRLMGRHGVAQQACHSIQDQPGDQQDGA